MSSENYEIPWSEGKIRTLDVTETVEQGQLLNATGILATKGTDSAGTGRKAHYIAGASITSAGRLGAYQNSVVGTASIALGTAGDPVYLGADGNYTLVTPLVGDSDILQTIGFVRPDGRAQINLESNTATVL